MALFRWRHTSGFCKKWISAVETFFYQNLIDSKYAIHSIMSWMMILSILIAITGGAWLLVWQLCGAPLPAFVFSLILANFDWNKAGYAAISRSLKAKMRKHHGRTNRRTNRPSNQPTDGRSSTAAFSGRGSLPAPRWNGLLSPLCMRRCTRLQPTHPLSPFYG